MDDSTLNFLIVVMAGAVCVSAIALVIQAGLLYATFKATQEMRDNVKSVVPQVEGLVQASKVVLEESRAGIAEVREKSVKLIDSSQRQVDHVQAFLSDASSRTKTQLDHAEAIIDDALSRTQDTVALVHKGILKPIRGVTGLAAAITTAIHFLARRSAANPDRVALDEEMFI